jgi:hypothetical protein
MVVSDETHVVRTSSLLSVAPSQITKAKKRKAQHGMAFSKVRAVRKDRLSDEIRLGMTTFWENETRAAAAQKHQVKRRIGRKMWEEHCIHWLSVSERELYGEYVKTFLPDEKAPSFWQFNRNRPWYVRRVITNLTCVCVYCKRAYDMVKSLHVLRKDLHGKTCTCACAFCTRHCGVNPPQAAFAPRSGNFFHFREDLTCDLTSLACASGDCEACRYDTIFDVCPRELAQESVHYREYVNETYQYRRKVNQEKVPASV